MASPFRWLVLLALLATGCTGFWVSFTVDKTALVMQRAVAATNAESDVQLARDATPGNIKMVDGFLAANPDQRELLELVSMAYAQYAFAFLEDDLEVMGMNDTPARRDLVERCTRIYDRAFDVAARLLEQDDKTIRTALKGDVAGLERALAKLKPKSVPGLYWAGFALGSVINLHRDDMDRVGELPKAMALLERAHTLDPKYFHDGSALALGVAYASLGPAVGGKPERAKQMFAEAIAATDGKYLMGKVMYARYYATITLDRALFEETLHQVLATPPTVWPEERLANELAHRRAARYLKQADDLF